MNPEVCLCSVIVSLNLLFNVLNSLIKNYLQFKKKMLMPALIFKLVLITFTLPFSDKKFIGT